MSTRTIPHQQIAASARVWQTGLLAAAIAAVLNLAVYLISGALGVSFEFGIAGQPTPPFAVMVVVVTFIGVLLGTLVFSVMPRFSPRPVSTFRVVAIIALVLSLFQPLMLLVGALPLSTPVGISTILALEVMHLIAGVVAIHLLTTRARA